MSRQLLGFLLIMLLDVLKISGQCGLFTCEDWTKMRSEQDIVMKHSRVKEWSEINHAFRAFFKVRVIKIASS